MKTGDEICVCRQNSPVRHQFFYNEFVGELKYPQYEGIGPTRYAITKIRLVSAEKYSFSTAEVIPVKLSMENRLEVCLELADLEQIRKKGRDFFRRHFRGKKIFAWRSVCQRSVMSRRPDLASHVPFLSERGGKVVISWFWDGWDIKPDHYIARFVATRKV